MAAPKQLLVEGTDDYHVILNLQGSRGIRILDKKQIHDLQGVENLLESLPVRIRASEGGAVGAVLDADTSLADRWRGIRDRMERLGYTDVPADPAPEGTILMPPAGTLLPRVGIWLMPDNSTSGILEDFLRFLVPPRTGSSKPRSKPLIIRRTNGFLTRTGPRLSCTRGWRGGRNLESPLDRRSPPGIWMRMFRWPMYLSNGSKLCSPIDGATGKMG